MQRDVGRIPHHPTIVTGRSGWNVKEHAGAEFVDRAILHRSRGTAGEHQPNMLDVAARRTHAGPDVNRPLPAGLVCGTADGRAPDADQFKFSFFEHSYFVRLLKALQNCLNHRHNSFASRICGNAAHHASSKLDALSQNSSVTSASRRLSAPHSPVQSSNAKRVRRPGNLAKARLMHTPEHFIRRRKALYRCRQICVWTSHSREQRPDCGKNFLKIDTITVPDQAARLSEVENAALSAGSEHPRNFTQSRVVVGQVSKTKC